MKYFLGMPTADGFKTALWSYCEAHGIYVYVLKGGAGTGKSTLLKRLAENSDDAEVYFCASDPRSLDAVLLKKKGIMICDGTAPHCYDPKYPAITGEIINLGDFWDGRLLRSEKTALLKLFEENAAQHRRAADYRRAASMLTDDLKRMTASALRPEALTASALRLAERLFPPTDAVGEATQFQRSALTPSGHIRLEAPSDWVCYHLNDEKLAASAVMLELLAAEALSRGYSVNLSFSALSLEKTPDELLVPELKLCIRADKADAAGEGFGSVRKIKLNRFYDSEKLADSRRRFAFGKKLSEELMRESVGSLAAALRLHDDIEDHYIRAMSFGAAEIKLRAVFGELL